MKKSILFTLGLAVMVLTLLAAGCKKLTEDEKCTIPTNLRLMDVTNTTLKMAWDGVADAEQYRFGYRKSGTTAFTESVVTGSVVEITGLEAGTNYEVKIQANCAASNSAFSTPMIIKTKSNYETHILKKWKFTKWVENEVPFSLTASDYLEFNSSGSFNMSFPGMPSSGTWSFNAAQTTLTISSGSDTRIWNIVNIDVNSCFFTKTNSLSSNDTLQLAPF